MVEGHEKHNGVLETGSARLYISQGQQPQGSLYAKSACNAPVVTSREISVCCKFGWLPD